MCEQESVYRGYYNLTLSEEDLAKFYAGEYELPEILANQYLIIREEGNDAPIKFLKYDGENFVNVPYSLLGDKNFDKPLKPRNPEQRCAWDMLKDPKSTIKLITGRFGSGKTVALIMSALEQLSTGKYEKIVWVRNNIEVKNTVALGSVPGNELEKLQPFLGPFKDHATPEYTAHLIETGKLEVVHLGFLRGRDIKNSIIICSEAENLTKEHIQLLMGRVSVGSVLYFDADLKQRDKDVFEKSAGIECLIERLQGNPLFAYVHLTKSERSETAALADLLD